MIRDHPWFQLNHDVSTLNASLPPSKCILITILYISSSSTYINRTCCLHSSCCWLLQSPVALHVLIKESNILILLLAFRHPFFWRKVREMHTKSAGGCRVYHKKSGLGRVSLSLSHPALPTTTTVLLGETGRNIMRWKAATLACSPL